MVNRGKLCSWSINLSFDFYLCLISYFLAVILNGPHQLYDVITASVAVVNLFLELRDCIKKDLLSLFAFIF